MGNYFLGMLAELTIGILFSYVLYVLLVVAKRADNPQKEKQKKT